MRFSYKDILNIVYPLIISGFGQSIIYITDTLFLGRLGEVALGASAIAGLFYATLMMIGFGISSGMQVIIAQKYGEQKEKEIPDYLFNGIFIQLLLSLSIVVFYYIFQNQLMETLISNNEIKNATREFLNIRVLGFVPYFLFYSYRAYYLGIGQTKIISVATIVMSILNLALNPLLIYGYKNIVPMLGYCGSAWASVVAEWVSMFLIMAYYAVNKKSFKFISFLQLSISRYILKMSLPLILQHFISVFSWFLFFVFIEKMGERELAVSNIIRAVYILIMSPILAFSHTTVTIIGQLFGALRYGELKPTLWKVVMLSVLFTLPFSIIALFEPHWLVYIFTNDVTLVEYSIPVMQVIAFALIFFAVSLPCLSAVTGLGKTIHSFFIELTAFIVYVLTSYVFVFVFKWSLPMVWLNEFVYFACILFLSYMIFVWAVKKEMIKEQ